MRITQRLFPERQVFVRTPEGTPRFIRLSSGVQQVAAAALLLAAGSVAWLTASQLTLGRITISQSDEMRRIEETYHRIIESVGTAEPGTIVSEHQGAAAAPAAGETAADLKRRIVELERRLAESETGRRLLAGERDKIELERKRLAASVAAMEKRINESLAAHQESVKQLINRAKTAIDRASRNLSYLGLEPQRMLAKEARSMRADAAGGPFIEFKRVAGEPVPAGLSTLNDQIIRLTALRRAMAALPVGAPLARAQIASPFGVRRDPINGKLAMHYGLDLMAPAGAPVLIRSGGRVTFAGANGPYGNMVEVDHGFGVRTRYGHLSKIDVREGQDVTARTKIGEVGSTGRSTGPHLHYEVTFNGRTLNPKRFVEAKQHVFQN